MNMMKITPKKQKVIVTDAALKNLSVMKIINQENFKLYINLFLQSLSQYCLPHLKKILCYYKIAYKT